MPWKQPENFNWLVATFYSAFAAMGGLLGHLMRAVDKGDELNLTRAALETFGAAFVGSLVTLACMAAELNPLWSGTVVGVAGWLGASASIRVLEIVIYKWLKISKDDLKVAKDINDEPNP